jgi:hypothetical protein
MLVPDQPFNWQCMRCGGIQKAGVSHDCLRDLDVATAASETLADKALAAFDKLMEKSD